MYQTSVVQAQENKTNSAELQSSQEEKSMEMITVEDKDIIRSSIDNRAYKIIQLKNGLKVMLVSDKEADKAAVSLDVSVGSGNDPEDAQGLAHFLEHMLFLGNEKFKQPGEYQAFIQQHGGSTNAFTAYDQTNYFFDIDTEYLEPAIDRFAQFFISPLFDKNYAQRERNIVDSEYNARKSNEFRRIFSARKYVFNPEHPITKFSIGNNETLSDNEDLGHSVKPIHNKLIDFYDTYYSASIMALTIIGNQPLDELETLAVTYFTDIKNNGYEVEYLTETLYTEGSLPKLLKVKPLKEQRSITLSFVMPEVESQYEIKPSYYISNLIGHEGSGSLLSLLKQQGLANSLSAGLDLSHKEEASFSVNINVTEKGFNEWQSVVSYFYEYLDLIKSQGVNQRLYEEQAKITQLDFDFQRRIDNSEYALSISHYLKNYPLNEVLSASLLMNNFDAKVIQHYLSFIKVDNMLLTIVGQDVETNQVSQYYDAEYVIEDFDDSQLEAWKSQQYIADKSDLSLPEENVFIAQNTELLTETNEIDKPSLVVDDNAFQFWYKNDTSFDSPRANLYISLRSSIVGKDGASQALNQLYSRIINEYLNEFLYPAYLADLNVSIYPHLRGMTIRIGGFNDKQNLLIKPVFETLVNQKIEQSVFDLKKDEMLQQLKSSSLDMPYQRLYATSNDIFLQNSWPIESKIKALENIALTDVEKFQQQLLENIEIVALNHGNVTKEQAQLNVNAIEQELTDKVNFSAVSHSAISNLNQKPNYLNLLNVRHADNAVMVISQAQNNSLDEKARMILLYQLIDTAFYFQLRTEQQLGYIVNTGPYSSLEYPGIALIVESSSHPVGEIYTAISEFMLSAVSLIESTDDENFEALKQGLISNINKRDENLEERTNRLWHELDRENFDFDTREKLIAKVEKLSKKDMLEFADKVFKEQNDNQQYSRLILTTLHDNENADDIKTSIIGNDKDAWYEIESIEDFKYSVEYFDKK